MKKIFLFILLGLTTTVNAINPDREYKWTPNTFGLKYSEYKIKTTDNYSINVWEYGLPDSVTATRTIILVGPDAGNMSYSIWQIKPLVEKGIRVISFDYRGFGKSSDFEMNKEFLYYQEFALDLDSVIKSMREKYPTDKVGLYSLSMGTYISLIKEEKIDFLIAEGFYNNPQKIVDRIKVNKGKTILLPTGAKTIDKLKTETSTLIFCADKDKTTITEDAREFSKNNTVTIVEFNGDHLQGRNSMTKDNPGDEYFKSIMDFLTKSEL